MASRLDASGVAKVVPSPQSADLGRREKKSERDRGGLNVSADALVDEVTEAGRVDGFPERGDPLNPEGSGTKSEVAPTGGLRQARAPQASNRA